MMAKFARAGKLTANFYTDGWPEFTTTVCHILSPATCDVSIRHLSWQKVSIKGTIYVCFLFFAVMNVVAAGP